MTIDQLEKEVEKRIEATVSLFIENHSPEAWTDETHAEFVVALVGTIVRWKGGELIYVKDGFNEISQLRLTIAMKYKGLGLDRRRFGDWLVDEGLLGNDG